MADDVKLEDFTGFNFTIEMKEPIEEYAEKCNGILKTTSPSDKRTGKKYKDGWKIEYKKHKDSVFVATIWNSTTFYLTHLLENGHQIVNKKGGVGWASAKPHIELAYQKVKQPFIEAMKNVNIK